MAPNSGLNAIYDYISHARLILQVTLDKWNCTHEYISMQQLKKSLELLSIGSADLEFLLMNLGLYPRNDD